MGWSLSVPSVTRKTSRGIPRYQDDADVFLIYDLEDLVPVEGPPSQGADERRTRYRPRTDELFARIVHQASPRENFWELRTPDGLLSFYGTPRPRSAPPDWLDPAALTDPADPRRVARWCLTETRDPFGNPILYDYAADTQAASARPSNQLYLRRMRCSRSPGSA